MESKMPFWFAILLAGVVSSMVIAYPIVTLFVTLPIQRRLRVQSQDYITNWAIWPFRSGVYAMAAVIPFTRWEKERNRSFVQGMNEVRKTATPVQWLLSFWLLFSLAGNLLLALFLIVVEIIGGWPA